ncbi:MAG: hypothetical protein J0H53_25840 [Rhizobiales bacterium]|nr:hypothetical protein [Hyphomicrobiales bacterium]
MATPAMIQPSRNRRKGRDAERLERLLIELTGARDHAHAVADSDYIVYLIEMALLEVADRSRAARG